MRIVIVGATGGLGSALVDAYRSRGHHVIAIARDGAKLANLAGASEHVVADLSDLPSVASAAARCGSVDVCIFATGLDIRKSLAAHSDADVVALVHTNLVGPIVFTRAILPNIREGGCIAHIGGFGDGRLAFPYYSVDVATRAGIAGFCESVTRECQAEGRDVVVSYLCPDPTDTPAERPFAEIWAQMGSRMASVGETANFLLAAIDRRRRRKAMSIGTTLAATINSLSPDLADALGVKAAGLLLRKAFG